MSKAKRARFHLKRGEVLIKQGMMDFSVSGRYAHFLAGNAYLTNERFYFASDASAGEFLTFELPLADISFVGKVGIPFLTRSMLIVADGRRYRLNAFFVGRWVMPLRRAVASAGEKKGADRQEDTP